jgi:hypothetical protein
MIGHGIIGVEPALARAGSHRIGAKPPPSAEVDGQS